MRLLPADRWLRDGPPVRSEHTSQTNGRGAREKMWGMGWNKEGMCNDKRGGGSGMGMKEIK